MSYLQGSQVADYLQTFSQLPDYCPLLALLDIRESRYYIHQTDDVITKDMVKSIVSDFKNDTLKFVRR